MSKPAIGGHGKRRKPQTRTVSGGANALGQMRHAIREAFVEAGPIADSSLISIVNLYDVERDRLLRFLKRRQVFFNGGL